MYIDDSDEEVTDLLELEEKIDSELHFYKSTKLSHNKKLKTNILSGGKITSRNFRVYSWLPRLC